ncbi:hypothetical protein Pan44_51580 [Caulifigura coniformis]|uniref:Uncharacterized protein n=1 Tax=Caulifigura coniformis TaxID=2527983 RepID=A0A517SLT9_9PLAN|nr:hypothetical protein Pan44_51580 [Caulifigura coniformis]
MVHPPEPGVSMDHTPGIEIRWFTHRSSMVHTPEFDGLHTGHSGKPNGIRALPTAPEAVTQILTLI